MTVDATVSPSPRPPLLVATAAVGALLLVAGLLLALSHGGTANHTRASSAYSPSYSSSAVAGSTLDREIARTQQQLRDVPADDAAWATLGFDYVQQAKLTVDPSYYPKAEAALARSLRLDSSDNFLAMAGQATLAAARHDFRGALFWARRGLRVDAHSAVLYGALTDALTQLGHYHAAAQAARRMELLSPGTPAEARLSYVDELRGDTRGAVEFMRRALADAAGPADVAFTRYYLGELMLGSGRAQAALHQFAAGLSAGRTDAALLEGRAKAEAALGRTSAAVRDFATVVSRVPQPGYVLEYGELLQSVGRMGAAAREWQLFRTEEQLFRANGVTLDSDETLFEADHGNPATAVRVGSAAVRTRPFVETYDAYGWALHRAGDDARALVAADTALHTGMRNALFLFHRGEIERSLGRAAAARADLTASLSLNPRFSPLWAPRAEADLAALRAAR